jgi:protein gp37
VSVESQRFAHRLYDLARTPAALRLCSFEPLLARVDASFVDILRPESAPSGVRFDALRGGFLYGDRETIKRELVPTPPGRLDWAIVGGESGPRSRPFDVAHALAIVRDCKAAGVPVFVKQLGALPFDSRPSGNLIGLKDRKGGDMGEWPDDLAELRVREFPTTTAETTL